MNLERDLRDERELRSALERRIADEVEKTATWRRRAEERAERIDRLQRELRRARRPLGLVRRLFSTGGGPTVVAPPPDQATDAGSVFGTRPRLPTVTLAAVLGDPGHVPVLAEGRSSRGPTDPAADLLLVDGPGWEALAQDARDDVIAMLERPAPLPLVVWGGSADRLPPVVRSHAAAVVDRPGVVSIPDRRTGSADPPISITSADLAEPTTDLLRAAVRGAPIRVDGEGGDPDRASVAARRWAMRRHAPWIRLSELLTDAGVDHPSPLPSVAAVLVSNRPDRVGPAVRAMLGQSIRPRELIVVLHGIEADRAALAGTTRVIDAPSEWSLGRCLNAGVEASGCSVIAKIDDDDDYGSHHLEDSVHTLLATDAGVVGKAAMHVYLADEDRTVVRRLGDEDRDISGTMPGGSLVFWRRVWDAVRFPHRPRYVDTVFLEGVRAVGETTRASHRFEFCLVRHGRGHTYEASTELLAAGAIDAWPGHHPERIDVADLDAGV